jgi:hypothetical protein
MSTDTAAPEDEAPTADGEQQDPKAEAIEVEVVEDRDPDEATAELAIPEGGFVTASGEIATLPGHSEFIALMFHAKVLSAAGLVPKALQDRPADVLLVLLTARDLGIAETTALRELHPIDGRVTISPKLKMALVRTKGLGTIWFDGENDDESATVFGVRADDPGNHVHVSRYTMDMAKRAKLAGKDNWKAYPERMLQWRALGYLIDDLWPEVGGGLYTPDEMGANTDADGQPIEIETLPVPEGFEGRREQQRQRRQKRGVVGRAFTETMWIKLRLRVEHLTEPAQQQLREMVPKANLPNLGQDYEGTKVEDDRGYKRWAAVLDRVERAHDITPPEGSTVIDEEPPQTAQEDAGGPEAPVDELPILCGACGEEPCVCAPEDAQTAEAPEEEPEPVDPDEMPEDERPFD